MLAWVLWQILSFLRQEAYVMVMHMPCAWSLRVKRLEPYSSFDQPWSLLSIN
jgi:hypothetical protein